MEAPVVRPDLSIVSNLTMRKRLPSPQSRSWSRLSRRRPARTGARVPKIIVVDRAGKLAVDMEKALSGIVPEPEILKLDRPTQVVEVAEAEDPDVIVYSPDEVTAAGLKRLAEIHRVYPRIVILLSDTDKTWSGAQIAASGASDFLPANPTKPRLRSKLEAALKTAEHLRVEPIVVTERVVIRETEPAAALHLAPLPASINPSTAAVSGDIGAEAFCSCPMR